MSALPHKSPAASRQEQLFIWTERQKSLMKKPRSGEIKARSIEQARYELSKLGIRNVRVTKAKTQLGSKIKLDIVAAFVRQLATMIQSGVPLALSLGLIASGMKDRKRRSMQQVVRTIKADVESGMKISEAMRKHPRCFDNLFCNTLASGEDAGQLDNCLHRLATYMEKSLRTRQKIKKAITYPTIVVIVAVVVSCAMLLFVLPTFKGVFSTFNKALPALTQTLLDLSDLLKEHGIVIGILLVGCIYAIMQAYKKNMRFRNAMDAFTLKIPVIGQVLRTAIYARWTRTFSTLSTSGVPVTSALESVAAVADNKRYQDATLEVRMAVATGAKVSDSLEKTGLFEQETIQMMRIGEESGTLDVMVERIATAYETKLDDLVDNLSTLIEPMIMCLIAGLVGTMVVGMYLPIFGMGDLF